MMGTFLEQEPASKIFQLLEQVLEKKWCKDIRVYSDILVTL
jgi:hypothetical protein